MKYINRKIALSSAILSAILLSGCAQKSQVSNMIIKEERLNIKCNSKLKENLAIETVSGGEETNPLWTSQVANEDFRQALEKSLQIYGLYTSDKNSKYIVSAYLQNLDQPLMGFDMTVIAQVRYQIVERRTNKIIFNQVISTPFTATVSDAFVGVERLRLANEGAIKTNIEELIKKICTLQIDKITL